jgi:hypothetical protein
VDAGYPAELRSEYDEGNRWLRATRPILAKDDSLGPYAQFAEFVRLSLDEENRRGNLDWRRVARGEARVELRVLQAYHGHEVVYGEREPTLDAHMDDYFGGAVYYSSQDAQPTMFFVDGEHRQPFQPTPYSVVRYTGYVFHAMVGYTPALHQPERTSPFVSNSPVTQVILLRIAP